MRTVFFGTPEWAVPSLRALLHAGADVAAVVTNPDRPAGRGMKLVAPPVKALAEESGLPVLQPKSPRDPAFHDAIRGLQPEVCVVVAYGKILPVQLLDVPPRGFVNVHFSLLPRYRGAAPVQRAIMEGEPITGVSIMVLTEGMDEGPVLATAEEPIRDDDSAGSLGERLAETGATLLADTLPRYVEAAVDPIPQDHDLATYAPKIDGDEARIDWSWDRRRIDAHARGLDPAPGAWTELEGTRLRVFRVTNAEASLQPGELAVGRSLVVGAGDGAVELTDVQLAGKRRMAGGELARGLRVPEGAKLG